MNRSLSTLVVFAVLAAAASGQTGILVGQAISLNQPIPPQGTGGTCGTPQSTAVVGFTVTTLGVVHAPAITLNIDHTFVGDLTMTLSHGGTSVTLSNGNSFLGLPATRELHGNYTFQDSAPTAFLNAPWTGVTFNPGAYRPASPLAVFNGMAIAGTWTLTICDEAPSDSGVLHSLEVVCEFGGAAVADVGLPAAIPPQGTGGVCSSPGNTTVRTVNIGTPGRVAYMWADLNMNHTFSSDLRISISHNGVTRMLFDGDNDGTGSAAFAGTYSFNSGPGPQINGASVSGGTVQPGSYAARESLSVFTGMEMSGAWTLSICDQYSVDTGSLNGLVLRLASEGFTLSLAQPSGSASISAHDANGSAVGNGYFNAFTTTAGAYPYGWFEGIDILQSELLFQLNLPLPLFAGTLGANVDATPTLTATIPGGITLYGVALEIGGNQIRQVAPPIAYTTAP